MYNLEITRHSSDNEQPLLELDVSGANPFITAAFLLYRKPVASFGPFSSRAYLLQHSRDCWDISQINYPERSHPATISHSCRLEFRTPKANLLSSNKNPSLFVEMLKRSVHRKSGAQ